LFEPFFTTKIHGTGLGLAISQRIALEHHGSIRVQSEPGKGSTFSLSLPGVHRGVSGSPINRGQARSESKSLNVWDCPFTPSTPLC